MFIFKYNSLNIKFINISDKKYFFIKHLQNYIIKSNINDKFLSFLEKYKKYFSLYFKFKIMI